MKNIDKSKSNDGKHIEDKRDVNRNFAVIRRKRRKQLLKFGVPVAVAVVAFDIFVTIQAHQQGIGADIVYHIHPNLTPILNRFSTLQRPFFGQTQYGGMAPIHTHDSSGVIYVESI